MNKIFFLGLTTMAFFNTPSFAHKIEIITVDGPFQDILRKKTEDIQEDEFVLAKEIAEKLFLGLAPHFPAAGLAAPQIGINKSVFIFSFNRDPKNLEVVINPSFSPLGEEKIEGWEGCFSVPLCMTKVSRYKTIRALYLNSEGIQIEKILEGFGAKVFQHEYDHLQGIENIDREDAVVKNFISEKELEDYLNEVKKEDALKYTNPHAS